jgi:hypothetical protein
MVDDHPKPLSGNVSESGFLFMLAISLGNYARVVQFIGYLVGYKDLMDKSLFGCSTYCLEKGHSGI